ncbi:hypothetical protein EZV62_011421 [Acer yangbiense]|uniref:BZIP domain-containing protein n=1 Tax=Acer yangbiense TaxID=1000413 RepID=A0A5C7I567_9ROSI|nr:hypothetical protein EZV62_011421 [Acer yangbiense]
MIWYSRQLRNRSKERKKMYVKDLEMKSGYLERECRRLGRLLQCVVVENQALHFSLPNGNASLAKQESAVLFLECATFADILELGIPAVGLPALDPGHHVPVYSAPTNPVKSGVGGRKGGTTRKSGSKRSGK